MGKNSFATGNWTRSRRNRDKDDTQDKKREENQTGLATRSNLFEYQMDWLNEVYLPLLFINI